MSEVGAHLISTRRSHAILIPGCLQKAGRSNAAEWLTELGAVEREAVDGTVVQVCQIPVLGSLSRFWLLL